MWTFFSRTSNKNNLNWMGVDMHSHLLPGLDDGCKTIDESLTLIERVADLGISKFHFTPHIFTEMYPNDKVTIDKSYHSLLGKGLNDVISGYAAEYMTDTTFDHYISHNNENILSLPGKYVLIEMSYMQENKQIEKIIFDLQVKGYSPILAHPERYVYYHNSPEKIVRFKEIGCFLQMNLLSAIGYYGSHEKKIAKFLSSNGLIDLVGTDIHHERHVNAIEQGLKKINFQSYFKNCRILNEELFGAPK